MSAASTSAAVLTDDFPELRPLDDAHGACPLVPLGGELVDQVRQLGRTIMQLRAVAFHVVELPRRIGLAHELPAAAPYGGVPDVLPEQRGLDARGDVAQRIEHGDTRAVLVIDAGGLED